MLAEAFSPSAWSSNTSHPLVGIYYFVCPTSKAPGDEILSDKSANGHDEWYLPGVEGTYPPKRN